MNELIISYLKKLESLSTHKGDTYRARAFKKAKQTINSLDFDIKNISQIKNRVGIGKGIIQRVQEIIDTKKLKEVDEEITDVREVTLEKFMNIHGVGLKTAEKWFKQGYRDLKDLIKNEKLTHAQQIGIKYYDELNQKIPKKIIEEIDFKLQRITNEINFENKIDLECVIAGSYRRKLKESGDIDCLLTERNSKLDDQIIDLFLNKLKKKKILTDELGRGEDKFIGVCVDSKGIHRRIDFEFCRDYNSFPYDLLYFTGSQQLNMEMRLVAKEKGMLLNQKGLFKNNKIIPVKSEKEIFEQLGMMYLKPEERF